MGKYAPLPPCPVFREKIPLSFQHSSPSSAEHGAAPLPINFPKQKRVTGFAMEQLSLYGGHGARFGCC